ncbi:putative defensin-like protein 89 [Capsella rubella]|uniref:putative defensin-like protein 89 n=1 Tax=Capsella rubella TaxID=81985 RepID=UPI000CD4BB21|nr:putative defensin-like protein 89 [Capsella rubella]
MGIKNLSCLILLMVCAFILLPMTSASGARQCYLEPVCSNSGTCNEFCRYKGYPLGGFCERYGRSKKGHCCCYYSFESQKSSKSHDTNF